MAKGAEINRRRRDALSGFGKDLTRRARSRCELCAESGVPLSVYELPPSPAEPDFERCLFLCAHCGTALESNAFRENVERWRCLNNSVWSETPAVQAAAVRVLRALAESEPWAVELLEQVYLEEETEALLQ